MKLLIKKHYHHHLQYQEELRNHLHILYFQQNYQGIYHYKFIYSKNKVNFSIRAIFLHIHQTNLQYQYLGIILKLPYKHYRHHYCLSYYCCCYCCYYLNFHHQFHIHHQNLILLINLNIIQIPHL